MEQINKKSKIVWYVLGAIVLLLVCLKFIIIASYPGDEIKFNKVFSEKYWKITDIELKALTIDGEDISSPNQTIGNKIQDKIDNKSNTDRWINAENALKKMIDHDNFFIAKKTAGNGYMIYAQSFDTELNNNSYTLTNYDFNFIDARYNLSFNKAKQNEYIVGDELQNIQSTIFYENYSMSVISISEDELYVEIKLSIPPGELNPLEVKVEFYVNYKSFQPATEFVNFANKTFTSGITNNNELPATDDDGL
jgi:hypothetical protein